MKLNLKMLGLAVVAALALTAVVASAAQAASFHSEAETTSLTGTQTGNHVFNAAGAKITCKNATFTGTQTGTVANDVTVGASYKNCSFLFFNVNVNMNGCEYTFHSNNTVDVVGAACKGITYEGAGCKVVVGAQSGLSTVGFATAGAGSSRTINVSPNVTGIKYTSSGLCPENGTNLTNGKYESGPTNVVGKSGGVQVGISFE
jgi:hypothetical protein